MSSRQHQQRPPVRPAAEKPAAPERDRMMILLRYVLPGLVVLAGIVLMAFASEADLEGGGGIVSAGLAIFFINWLFRAGASSDREREAEDRARDYFSRHGRWPS